MDDKKKRGSRGKMPSAPIKMPAYPIKGIGRLGQIEGGATPTVVPARPGNPTPLYGWMGKFNTNSRRRGGGRG